MPRRRERGRRTSRRLETWLTNYADLLERSAGTRARDIPGAGAAGGTGFGLLCLAPRMRSFELVPGIDAVMQETGFDDRLAAADLVITGEGRIDDQTAFGKTALGVARRAAAADVPCLAIGGGVTPEGVAALADAGTLAVPVAGPAHVARGRDEPGGLARGCRGREAGPADRTRDGRGGAALDPRGRHERAPLVSPGAPERPRLAKAAGRPAGKPAGRAKPAGPGRKPRRPPAPAPPAQARSGRSRPPVGGPARDRAAGPRRVRPGSPGRGRRAGPSGQRRLDPTSELVLTILSANSADTNAEAAFAALRAAYPSAPVPAERLDRAEAVRRLGRPRPAGPAPAGLGGRGGGARSPS